MCLCTLLVNLSLREFLRLRYTGVREARQYTAEAGGIMDQPSAQPRHRSHDLSTLARHPTRRSLLQPSDGLSTMCVGPGTILGAFSLFLPSISTVLVDRAGCKSEPFCLV